MAENEIIKHVNKAYTIFKSSGNSLKHKIIEIVIEILIIIFAVNTSIWFHDWSERKHDQKEEKEFLIGLKKDLQIDIENMTNSKIFYENTLNGIHYFLKAGKTIAINQDSINKYSGIFSSSTNLDPHIARYEGLKSSGRFKIIENKELLNNIIDLHETVFQRIQELNEIYYQHNEKLETLISQKLQLGKNGEITNVESILSRNDFNILLSLSGGLIVNNIISVHEDGINECNDIIAQIDKELK